VALGEAIMKLFRYFASGVALALLGVGAAAAGTLDIVYWGKDSGASVVVDGQSYSLSASDDWVTVQNIYQGAHSLTLYANGTSMSRDFTLTDGNTYSNGDKGPNWCMDLEDNGAEILDPDTCDDMMDYYFDGW
jgi:hypothetical protein